MIKASTMALALGACALVSSGCYTVFKSPYAASHIDREPQYASSQWDEGARGNGLSPRIGRFGREDERYGYRGSGYGQQGFPVFGYDSRFGPYGLYGFGSGFSGAPGYGSGSYSPGYGPYGYGYDPYYQGTGGVYIPPGYELVTTEELDRLRSDGTGLLSNLEPSVLPSADELRDRQLQQQERERQIWSRRQEQTRPATGLRRRPVSSSSTGSVKSAPKSTAKPSSSSSSSGSSGTSKKTARPAKKGR